MKLIVFPHAGGFSNYYSFMKEHHFSHIEGVYIYEYAGRGRKVAMPLAKSIQQVARSAALELKDVIGDDEYILFGHSMGAFVMYETMLILQKLLQRKAFLAISSGQVSPFGYEGIGFDVSSEEAVIEYIRSMGGTDDVLISNAEARSFFIPIIQGDLMAASSYYATEMSGSDKCQSIAVVYGEDDSDITDDNIRDWERVGENFLGNHIFSGGHFYMNSLADELMDFIEGVSVGEPV